MSHPVCLLCQETLNNTGHKLQFLRLAYVEEETNHRKYMIRIAVNCYTSFRHYKKWVPLDTLMEQIKAGEVRGRNIDLEPERDAWDIMLHLGGKPLIRWEDRDASDASPNEPVDVTM